MKRGGYSFPRLRQLREQAGWTIAELVKASDVSRALISKLERGEPASSAKAHAVFNALSSKLSESPRREVELIWHEPTQG